MELTLISFCILILVINVICFVYSPFQNVDGHFDHITYYNSESFGVGNKYHIDQELMPEYARPNESSRILFSIQDTRGNDVSNIFVMVEIYSADGHRLYLYPWTNLAIGDFDVPYTFNKSGNYQVVLSILNEDAARPHGSDAIPEERIMLTNNMGCNCERAVFNLSISETYGLISTLATYGIIFSILLIITVTIVWILKQRRKNKTSS